MAIYEALDLVVVPFPFTDRAASKRRPALVLSAASSFNTPSGHAVLAMVTSRKDPPWPLDVEIADLESAGLSAPSVVRMKLFTLDQEFILRKAGALGADDRRKVSEAVEKLLGAGRP